MVSRSWTNLYSLNSSFSLASSGSKSASIFLEGDWQPSLTPGSGGWTPSLPISMLACKFLPISLPEGSRLEVANCTASGPFYPLCTPRVPLQFSSRMAKLSACGKLVLLRSAGSGEATALPTVKMQPLCQCSLSACKNAIKPHQLWWEQEARMASGLLGPLESAAILSLVSARSGFQPPTELDRL